MGFVTAGTSVRVGPFSRGLPTTRLVSLDYKLRSVMVRVGFGDGFDRGGLCKQI